MLEARREVERLRRDDQHLDVGHVIGNPAGHAAGQHDLLGDVVGKRIDDALGELVQLLVPLVRHDGSIPESPLPQRDPSA